MIGLSFVHMDSIIPVMVLPGTIWSFQELTRVPYICDKLKHQKWCLAALFLLRVHYSIIIHHNQAQHCTLKCNRHSYGNRHGICSSEHWAFVKAQPIIRFVFICPWDDVAELLFHYNHKFYLSQTKWSFFMTRIIFLCSKTGFPLFFKSYW